MIPGEEEENLPLRNLCKQLDGIQPGEPAVARLPNS